MRTVRTHTYSCVSSRERIYKSCVQRGHAAIVPSRSPTLLVLGRVLPALRAAGARPAPSMGGGGSRVVVATVATLRVSRAMIFDCPASRSIGGSDPRACVVIVATSQGD